MNIVSPQFGSYEALEKDRCSYALGVEQTSRAAPALREIMILFNYILVAERSRKKTGRKIGGVSI